MNKELKPFLADTLWFGMTSRMSLEQIQKYAALRASQGFDAVQTVVGIPPEVGPMNQNAFSSTGPAWDLEGNFNFNYLDECEKKIRTLNEMGLKVIIYGAWGHQVDWLKVQGMKKWWETLIERFEKYDVIFCLTGESNLWIGQSGLLLPAKTSKDLANINFFKKLINKLPVGQNKIIALGKRIQRILRPIRRDQDSLSTRKEKWSEILEHVHSKTNIPLLIHTTHEESSLSAVNNPHLLAAITIQTGHSPLSKNKLWQEPIQLLQTSPGRKFINLEPWYEGILNNFYVDDQLYAYWVSMLSGAFAYCYGAHGVWNCGDGEFLSQWGKQTLSEALKLKTPELIGKSHNVFLESGALNFPYVETSVEKGELRFIKKFDKEGKSISFYPCAKYLKMSDSKNTFFLPKQGTYVTAFHHSESIVVVDI